MSDTYLNLTGLTSYDAKLKAIQEHNIDNGYTGVDLTQKCRVEIGGTDVWQWVKQRVAANDYECFNVADYIPIKMTETETNGGQQHEYHIQIMGMNSHTSYNGDIEPHIDWCSKESYGGANFKWNLKNNNNGTSESSYPYLVSELHKSYEKIIYPALPENLKAVISPKFVYVEGRGEGTAPYLTDSDDYSWEEIGNVWPPSEYEVFGSTIWGTKGYADMMGIQYPLFRSNLHRPRCYYDKTGALKYAWQWTRTCAGGSSSYCVYVSSGGSAHRYGVSGSGCAPLCFRISA